MERINEIMNKDSKSVHSTKNGVSINKLSKEEFYAKILNKEELLKLCLGHSNSHAKITLLKNKDINNSIENNNNNNKNINNSFLINNNIYFSKNKKNNNDKCSDFNNPKNENNHLITEANYKQSVPDLLRSIKHRSINSIATVNNAETLDIDNRKKKLGILIFDRNSNKKEIQRSEDNTENSSNIAMKNRLRVDEKDSADFLYNILLKKDK